MKNHRNHARHHLALILALVGLISTSTLVLSPSRPASAQAAGPSWSYTGSLSKARVQHTATLLQNGKVLVEGGSGDNSAELYEHTTGTWRYTGNLNRARSALHSATVLPNGKVLVAGGIGNCTSTECSILNSAELYDPATGTWSITSSLNTGRDQHTMTLLANGKVLVAGGSDYFSDLNSA